MNLNRRTNQEPAHASSPKLLRSASIQASPYASASVLKSAPAVEQESKDMDLDLVFRAAEREWVNPMKFFESPEDEGEVIDAMSDEWVAKIPKHFDQTQKEALLETETDTHFNSVLDEFNTKHRLDGEIAEYGLKGQVASGVAMVLDPTLWGAVLATEGAAATVLLPARLARAASLSERMLRAGAVGATGESAVAFLRSRTENDYTVTDAARDVALVGMLSAPFGLLYKGGARTLEEGMERNAAAAMGGIVQAADDTDIEKALNVSRGMGADEFNDEAIDLAGDASRMRYDDYALGVNSDNTVRQKITKMFAANATGGTNKSAAAEVDQIGSHYRARLGRSSLDNFKGWSNARGMKTGILHPIKEQTAKSAFSDEVYRAVVTGRSTDEFVEKAASDIRKINSELLENLKDAKVRGADGIKSDPKYIARYWEADKFKSAVETHGQKKVAKLIFNSLARNADEGVDEDKLYKIAIGFTYRMEKRVNFERRSINEILDSEQGYDELLRAVDGADEEWINELLEGAFKGGNRAEGTIDRLKSRMDLDMSEELDGLSMIDLVDTDAIGITQRYIGNTTGWSALARRGIASPDDWNLTLESAKGSAKAGKAEGDAAALERLKRELLGEPIFDENPTAAKAVRTMMNMNFTSAMGKAFFSAYTELGKVHAQNGILTTLKRVPELANVMKLVVNPTREADGIVGEINSMFGAVGDEHLMTLWGRYDDEMIKRGAGDSLLDKAEITSHKLATTMANHIAPIAAVDRSIRQFALSSSIDNFFNIAVKGKKTQLNLEEYGFDKAFMKSLKDHMNEHATVGKFGTVERLNIGAWDRGVAEKFVRGLTRLNTQQVQRTLTGEGNQMLTQSMLGRAFFQFRSFMINSYTKHLVRDLSDLRNGRVSMVAATWGLAALFSSLQYTARTYTESTGRPDRESFLRERLDFESDPFSKPRGAFWANTIGYMPPLGLPLAVYNTLANFSDAPALQMHRASDMKNDLTSFPMRAAVDRASTLARSLGKEDEVFNPRNATYFIPFQNTIYGILTQNMLLKN